MSKLSAQTFSENAYIIKFFSILIVFSGHFLGAKNWSILFLDKVWVVVTYALIFFSFTSGYFTSMRYGIVFDFKKFWKNKFYRIGIEYTFLNIFLLCIFILQGKQNLISISSLMSWLGLQGFLNWFNISSQSPFGAGIWFLTLLIIFYITYPIIAYACRSASWGCVFLIIFILSMFYFDSKIDLNHMLWITSCGFILGVFFSMQKIVLSYKMCFFIIAVEFFLISFLYLFHFHIRSSYIIFLTSIPLICVFFLFKIPDFVHRVVRPVSGTVFGIYILHNYTYVFITNMFLYDYILSLLNTIIIAYIISTLANKAIKRISL